MPGRRIFDGKGPKTQTLEAVKQLITYQHHGQKPAKWPCSLNGPANISDAKVVA